MESLTNPGNQVLSDLNIDDPQPENTPELAKEEDSKKEDKMEEDKKDDNGADQDEERKKHELFNMERWGVHKRWSDINFCRRLRNMRSQTVFDMNLRTKEKDMEREWHIREGRLETAAGIQKFDIDPWMKVKGKQLKPKWRTRVNL